MAQRTRKLNTVITGDSKGVEKSFDRTADRGTELGRKMERVGQQIAGTFDRAHTPANRFQKKMQGVARHIAGGFKTAFKGITLGVAGLVVAGIAVAKPLMDAAEESMKIGAQTEAVIKSTGKVARVNAKHVARYAEKLSLISGVDDEIIQQGENMLLTFTNIRNGTKKTNKIFDKATAIALDMSVAMGHKGVAGDALLLGKALNDPEKGIGRLTKVGVTFTQKQKDMITWMSRSGDTMGAQKIILQELTTEFGGSAAAQATTSDKIKTAWGNVQETLGTFLIQVLTPILNWFAKKLPDAIDWLQPKLDAFKAWFSEEGPKAMAALKEAWDGTLYPALKSLRDFVANDLRPWLLRLYDLMGGPKGLAYVIGTVLVIALGAYMASLALAIIMNIAAFWEFYLVVGVILLFVAALALLEDKFGFVHKVGTAFFQFINDLNNLFWDLNDTVGSFAMTLGRVWDLIQKIIGSGIGGIAKAVAGAGGGGAAGIIEQLVTAVGIPGFDKGGVVPGSMGAPTLALVHGGEEVLTPEQRGGGGDIYITVDARGSVGFDGASAGKAIVNEVNKAIRGGARLKVVG